MTTSSPKAKAKLIIEALENNPLLMQAVLDLLWERYEPQTTSQTTPQTLQETLQEIRKIQRKSWQSR